MTHYVMTEDACQIVRDIITLPRNKDYDYGTPGLKLTTITDDDLWCMMKSIPLSLDMVNNYISSIKSGSVIGDSGVSLKRCNDWKRCVRLMVRFNEYNSSRKDLTRKSI